MSEEQLVLPEFQQKIRKGGGPAIVTTPILDEMTDKEKGNEQEDISAGQRRDAVSDHNWAFPRDAK